jgi:glyoxylase-like metal-dependent hydrolase (beta-lactamase superfamily II)
MATPEIRTVVVGPFVQNVHLVSCPRTREGVLIDPGFEPEKALALVAKAKVKVLEVIATHGHIDHVWGAVPICRALKAPFRMHPADQYWLDALPKQAEMFALEPAPAIPVIDRPLADGEEIRFGDVVLRAIATPGHTPGSVCLHDGAGALFSGDTLFREGIGRTDFPGGSFKEIAKSIRQRLFALPPDTVVHCGHGPTTLVGEEKAGNPFVGDVAGGNGPADSFCPM